MSKAGASIETCYGPVSADVMAKAENIREVIAFPKIKDASCLMTNAPDRVDDLQLEELHLRITGE